MSNFDLPDLRARITLDSTDLTKVQGEARKTKTSLDAIGTGPDPVKQRLKSTGASIAQLKQVGDTMTVAVTAPLIAAGVASVRASQNFDQAFTNIVAQVGLGREEVEAMRGSVLELSGKTAQAPQELATALYFVTSAGLAGADAMTVLESSAKASAAGFGETSDIARGLTAVVNGYGAANIDGARATDVMVAAIKAGSFEAAELAGSLGQVVPLASQVGASFEDVAGAMALLSRSGASASEAATQLNDLFLAFLKPSDQAKELLIGVGSSAQQLNETLTRDGLVAALQLLNDKFDGNQEAIGRVIGSSSGIRAAFSIINADATALQGTFGQTADAAGALNTAFDVVSETDQFKMSQAFADLQAAAIEAGKTLAPIVTKMAEGIAGLASVFTSLPGPVQNTLLAIAALLAVVGPFLSITARLIQSMTILRGALLATGISGNVAAGGLRAASAAALNLTVAMGGVGVLLYSVGKAASILAAASAEAAEKQRELEAAFDSLRAALGTDDPFKGVKDSMKAALLEAEVLGADLNQLGVTVDELATAAATGGAAWLDMWDKLAAGGEVGEKIADVMNTQAGEFLHAAVEAVNYTIANDKAGRSALLAAAKVSLSAEAFARFEAAMADGVVTASELAGINVVAVMGEVARAANVAAGGMANLEESTTGAGSGLGWAAGGAHSAAGAVNSAGSAAYAAANGFSALAAAVNAAFSARSASANASFSTSSARDALAESRRVAAAGPQTSGGGGGGGAATRDAGDAALDAERKTRAYEDALRGVDDAGLAVADSQRGVEDAARGVVDANDGVADALREVQQASRDVAEAQRGVTEAEKDAAEAAEAVVDAQKAVAAAQADAAAKAVDLTKAQQTLQKVQAGFGAASPEGTDAADSAAAADRDARRAALSLAEAKDRVAAATKENDKSLSRGDTTSKRAIDRARDLAAAQLDLEEAQFRSLDTSKALGKAQTTLDEVVNGAPAGSERLAAAQDLVTSAQEAVEEANRKVVDSMDAVIERQLAVGESSRAIEEAHRKVGEAVRGVTEANEGVEEAHRNVEKAGRDVESANRDLAEALRGVEDANFRVREAEADRARDLGSTGGGGGGSGMAGALVTQEKLNRDVEAALRDVETAMRDEITAAGEAAVALAGPLATEKDKDILRSAAMKAKYDELAKTLAPDDPLRVNLDDYAGELGLLPTELTTKLLLDKAEAERRLEEYLRAVSAASSYGGELAYGNVQARAQGGPMSAGVPYLVHQNELVVPNVNSYVASASQTQDLLGGGEAVGLLRQLVSMTGMPRVVRDAPETVDRFLETLHRRELLNR